jgi:hypothetical protein
MALKVYSTANGQPLSRQHLGFLPDARRGRPRVNPTSIHLSLKPDQLAALDAWIARHPDPKPSASAGVISRRLSWSRLPMAPAPMFGSIRTRRLTAANACWRCSASDRSAARSLKV